MSAPCPPQLPGNNQTVMTVMEDDAILGRFQRHHAVLLTFACVCILASLMMMSRWPSWNEVIVIDSKAGRFNPHDTINLMVKKHNRSKSILSGSASVKATTTTTTTGHPSATTNFVSEKSQTDTTPLHSYSSPMDVADQAPTNIVFRQKQADNSQTSKAVENAVTSRPKSDENSFTSKPVEKPLPPKSIERTENSFTSNSIKPFKPKSDKNSFPSKSDKNSYSPKSVENSFTPKTVENQLIADINRYNSNETGSPAETEKKVYALSITTMKAPSFLNNFKNPCWLTGPRHNILRCIPYFYIAGFPKCGTTDLHYRVVGHPMIVPGRVKEPHYLTRHFYTLKSLRYKTCDVHCGTDLYSRYYYTEAARAMSISDTYRTFNLQLRARSRQIHRLSTRVLTRFPDESKAILDECHKTYRYPMITGIPIKDLSRGLSLNGILRVHPIHFHLPHRMSLYGQFAADSSASTAWDYNKWQEIEENEGLPGPIFITADWIKKVNPKARIVMILRDPVTRAFSDYVFSRREKATIEEFHVLVNKTIPLLNACFDSGTPPLTCTTNNYGVRLGISLYHLHVKNWLDRFPRGQVLVLRFEDYKRNSTRILEQVYKFLDLPALSPEVMGFITRSHAVNVSPFKYKLGHSRPETKDLLRQFYEPHNEKLAQLLGDKRFLWND